MYKLKKNGMKTVKLLHLITACCWLGGAFSMIILNLHNSAAVQAGALYGINMASHFIDIWVVVIMGAMGCLITGLIFGVFSVWGFFKHKWVAIKWLLTTICMLSGTFFLGEYEATMLEISSSLGNAALQDPTYLTVKAKHLYLSLVQVASLMFMIAISVIRPWGKKQTQAVK